MSDKTMAIKRTHKWFWNYDYDKQEKYYTEMHAKGWALKKQDGHGQAAVVLQQFEKCEPANVVYKIGYNAVKTDRDSYIQMFKDYGWEFVGEAANFYYFRKNADGVSEEELDIFSDDESRLDMAKKAVRAGLPILLVCTFCILIPQTIRLFNMEGNRNWVDWTLIAMYVLLWAVYVWGYIGAFLSYRRHKKQIEEKEPNAHK